VECNRELTVDAELKACRILESLIERLHDATVDYQCYGGVHRFVVRHAGSRFKIEFPEQSLLRRSEQDLEQVTAQIVERIRTHSLPGPTPTAGALTA
jgi:hypothetical protein